MPIIKSAAKRVRQTAKRKIRNQTTKRDLRTETKALGAAVVAKDGKKASEQLSKVQAQLDKAVKKNILKKNTAARKLARLSAQVKSLGAKPTKSSTTKPTPKAKTTTKPATKKPVAKKSPAKKPVAKKTAAKKNTTKK